MSEDARVTEQWGDPDPHRVWLPGAPPAPDPAPAPPVPGAYWLPPLPAWTPPPPVPLAERLRPAVATFAAATAGLVLLGAPLAYLWRAFTTPAVILHTASGPEPAAAESNQMFAVDGRFVVVMLLAGVACGVVAWALLRRRGPAAPAGIAAGGLLGSLVTAAVGRRIVVDRYLYSFCHKADVRCLVYDGTLHLHALAAVVVWPTAMLMVFAALTAFADREDSGPRAAS